MIEALAVIQWLSLNITLAKNKRRNNIGLEKKKQTMSDLPLLYLAHCVISFAQ
jgi:hypothetical protein